MEQQMLIIVEEGGLLSVDRINGTAYHTKLGNNHIIVCGESELEWELQQLKERWGVDG